MFLLQILLLLAPPLAMASTVFEDLTSAAMHVLANSDPFVDSLRTITSDSSRNPGYRQLGGTSIIEQIIHANTVASEFGVIGPEYDDAMTCLQDQMGVLFRGGTDELSIGSMFQVFNLVSPTPFIDNLITVSLIPQSVLRWLSLLRIPSGAGKIHVFEFPVTLRTISQYFPINPVMSQVGSPLRTYSLFATINTSLSHPVSTQFLRDGQWYSETHNRVRLVQEPSLEGVTYAFYVESPTTHSTASPGRVHNPPTPTPQFDDNRPTTTKSPIRS